jgi:hypothetical protein
MAVPALFSNVMSRNIPEASMDGPLLDLADPAVRRMIKLAKKRGYVTHGELDQILPPDVFSPEQIEDVLEQLSEMGIQVVEAAGTFKASISTLHGSFAASPADNGGRGGNCSKAPPPRSKPRPRGSGRSTGTARGCKARGGGFWCSISSTAYRLQSTILPVTGSGRAVGA